MSLIAPMLGSKTYPLDEKTGLVRDGSAMALVALSHTPVERRVYTAMLNAAEALAITRANSSETDPLSNSENRELFTVRRVMELVGSNSLSAMRRSLEGLVSKLSVAREEQRNRGKGKAGGDRGVAYRVFAPEEVIARRGQQGFKTFGVGKENTDRHPWFERVIQRVVENMNLSHREAQVALYCVEGLTNAQIGFRLSVTEQTVKFHLRNIFVKFGVKRRAELISRLLM